MAINPLMAPVKQAASPMPQSVASQPAPMTAQPNSAMLSAEPFRGVRAKMLNRQLLGLMQPTAVQGLMGLNQLSPLQMDRVRAAFAALNPANRMGRVEEARRAAMGQANDLVRQQSGMLGSNDQQLVDAMRIGALNAAMQGSNELMNELYNPLNDVQMAQAGAALLDPSVANPLLNQYMSLIQSTMSQPPKQRGPGLLGTALGLAGGAAGLGWSPFK